MESIFVYLYPLVTLNCIAAYLPQIRQLIKSDDVDSFSLSTWVMWIVGGAVTLGYGLTHLNDLMFIIATGANLVLMICIVAIVLHKRHKKSINYWIFSSVS